MPLLFQDRKEKTKYNRLTTFTEEKKIEWSTHFLLRVTVSDFVSEEMVEVIDFFAGLGG